MKRFGIPLAAGILITSVPVALVNPFFRMGWWKFVATGCDWPMLLVNHHLAFWVRGNEPSRLAVFYLINIVTWAVLVGVVCWLLRGAESARLSSGN